MVNIQSPAAEIRRGKKRRKKKEEGRRRRTNHSMKMYMVSLLHRATIKIITYAVHITLINCSEMLDYTNTRRLKQSI